MMADILNPNKAGHVKRLIALPARFRPNMLECVPAERTTASALNPWCLSVVLITGREKSPTAARFGFHRHVPDW